MKKIISLLLVMMLSASLVACGNDEKPSNDSTGNSTSSSQTENESSNKESSDKGSNDYEPDEELPGNLDVNLTTSKYSIDAPGISFGRANTGQIIEMSSYFVIYDQYVDISSEKQYEVKLDEIKAAKDVINGMSKQMAATAKNGLIFAHEYNVEATNSEDVKVNSWDMCKTIGKINLTSKYPLDYESANFVAYSVIKDGYPVYFAVVEKPDGENPIDINAMADKIAKTFREYSED